jgi:2-C-methyl-D-erythritol 4-phosphate cytidylyltransferase
VKVTAIVPAAGRGWRLKKNIDKSRPFYRMVYGLGNKGRDKPFVILGDKPILIRTLKVLSECTLIGEIVVAINKDNFRLLQRELSKEGIGKIVKIVEGGSTRGQSVYRGLNKINKDTNLVLIHDGVRPFVTQETISEAIKKAIEVGAAVVAIPVCSTIKMAKKRGKEPFVEITLNRDKLWEAQTPQVFRRELILKAYEKAMRGGFNATDDSSLVERLGYKVSIVPGSYNNIKITTPEDLIFAEAILKNQKSKI